MTGADKLCCWLSKLTNMYQSVLVPATPSDLGMEQSERKGKTKIELRTRPASSAQRKLKSCAIMKQSLCWFQPIRLIRKGSMSRKQSIVPKQNGRRYDSSSPHSARYIRPAMDHGPFVLFDFRRPKFAALSAVGIPSIR